MKIVYLCEFSAGVDGVWNRVYNIAKHLSKKHEVYVFSSNIEKGTERKAKSFEELDGIKIYRFPVYLRIGENVLFWHYENKLKETRPDIVHAHVFRHPHSTTAPIIARKLGAKCFLTTHAPFVDKNLRNIALNTAVSLYDLFLAQKVLYSYNKIIAITKWELPYLLKLGCKKENIIYIPNGFPKVMLKYKPKYHGRSQKTIIFLGRIASIKNPEILIEAFKELLDKGHKVNLKFVGQIEKGYEQPLMNLIKILDLEREIEFTGPIYDISKKIKVLQEADIFVLPSKREASPLALIEAMALGMAVVSSRTLGAKEIIDNGKNGLLFSDKADLVKKLEYCISNYSKVQELGINARKSVKVLDWEVLARREESLYTKS